MKKLSVSTKMAAVASIAAIAVSHPAAASQIELRGHVSTICEMRYDIDDSGPSVALMAELIVFCNSPYGAIVSATLMDGHESGYTFSSRAGSFVAIPGASVDIQSYRDAFAGREFIQITQIATSQPVTPTVIFEITLE